VWFGIIREDKSGVLVSKEALDLGNIYLGEVLLMEIIKQANMSHIIKGP
jgi:hypothetical protein